MAKNGSGAAVGGGALYGLGIFGAGVYFWQQADSFWEYVLVVFQAVFWPAWMVYEGFDALNACTSPDDHGAGPARPVTLRLVRV